MDLLGDFIRELIRGLFIRGFLLGDCLLGDVY
jgi:hypothetical protein